MTPKYLHGTKIHNIMKDLKNEFNQCCCDYARRFCERHGYEYSDDDWVGDEYGSMYCMGDLYINFSTIMYDVDFTPDTSELLKWYDYCIFANEMGLTVPNYDSWCRGCPRVDMNELMEMYRMKIELSSFLKNHKSSIKI